MLKREKTNGKVLPPQRCPHRPAAPPAGAALPFISEPHRVARGRGAPGEGTAERSGRGAVRCGAECGAVRGAAAAERTAGRPRPAQRRGLRGGEGKESAPAVCRGGLEGEGERGGGSRSLHRRWLFSSGSHPAFLPLGTLLLARVWKLQAPQPLPAHPSQTEPRPAASQPRFPHWGCGDPRLQPRSDRRALVRAPCGPTEGGGGGCSPAPAPLSESG